jgi:AraC family transcriptional regulator
MVSLDDLYKSDFNVDIALDYGYEYEKSYIRAFKQEFGITLGKLRKTGKIVKVTPPLHLFDARKSENGVLFGLEIVMVPQFYVIGKRYVLPSRDLAALTQKWQENFGIWNGLLRSKKKNRNDENCPFLIIPPYYVLLKIYLFWRKI